MGNKEKILQLMSNLESENIERTRAFDKADKMGQAICNIFSLFPIMTQSFFIVHTNV